MLLTDQLLVLQAIDTGLANGHSFEKCYSVLAYRAVDNLEEEWTKIGAMTDGAPMPFLHILSERLDRHVATLFRAGIYPAGGRSVLRPALDLAKILVRHADRQPIPDTLKDQLVALEVLNLSGTTGRPFHEAIDLLAKFNIGGHHAEWAEIASLLRSDGGEPWANRMANLLDPEVGALFYIGLELSTDRVALQPALDYLHILIERAATEPYSASVYKTLVDSVPQPRSA